MRSTTTLNDTPKPVISGHTRVTLYPPFTFLSVPKSGVLYQTSVLLARMFHYSSLLRTGSHLFPGTPWLTFLSWQAGCPLGSSSIAPAPV